ncbi:MAG: thymidine phosphorylase [Clostridia bacterium]|nr:thymidine phosphorylase [Clostridia bacterium]
MRMYDVIEKKRYNRELTKEEIEFFVKGYSNGEIPDYQASALLMAICINGLTREELVHLTFAMSNSSGRLDLSELKVPGKYIVDKHSTGGVGDKVTLIVLPIVAALGVDVCKMSGRGLGYTGGTADKLEAIEGYDINIPLEDAIEQVKKIGVCLISQSSDIAIADKKIYALRDTTATVESIDLIASSIMSKKLASGVDKILLDVTVGSGAFMKNLEDARKLARTMVDIGNLAGVETKAIITSMSEPLGRTVGNAVEIKEVIEFLLSNEETLYSNKSKDLKEVVFEIAAYMIKMSGLGDDMEQNKKDIFRCIVSGQAYKKFIELVMAQNGQVYDVYMDWVGKELPMPVIKDTANYLKEIHAQNTGVIVAIDSKKIGEALVCIGGGRIKKDDEIDYAVGFDFVKKTGDVVQAGETILKAIYNDKDKFEEAFGYIEDAIVIENRLPEVADEMKHQSHILDIVE